MNFLQKIITRKKKEISQAKKRLPFSKLKARVMLHPAPVRKFSSKRFQPGLKLIAEIKKGSPSKGVIRKDFNPVEIAGQYLKAGVDALSVLTDRKFFMGSPDILQAVSQISNVPVLRKDFLIDPYQLWESRLLGADMVLLIVACLPGKKLKAMIETAESLGLEVLTEVHDNFELARAFEARCGLIGVNNRDLRTFKTDINLSLRLIKLIPSQVMTVSESGIFTAREAAILRKAGYDAILVGEALMREKNPAKKIRELKIHD
jgi:indole-3-glycerol phosphate synthase